MRSESSKSSYASVVNEKQSMTEFCDAQRVVPERRGALRFGERATHRLISLSVRATTISQSTVSLFHRHCPVACFIILGVTVRYPVAYLTPSPSPDDCDSATMERRGSQQPQPSTPTRTITHGRAKSVGHSWPSSGTPGTSSAPMSPVSQGRVLGVPMSPASGSRATMAAAAGGLGIGAGVPMSPGPSGGGLGREVEWSDIQARTFCRW